MQVHKHFFLDTVLCVFLYVTNKISLFLSNYLLLQFLAILDGFKCSFAVK